MTVSLEDTKTLRELTGAGVMKCKRALEEASGDAEKARKILKKLSLEKIARRSGRETSQGLVHAYIHNGEKVGALVKLLCETDFVVKTPEFRQLVHDIAMQAAALKPESVDQLWDSEFIKDTGKKVGDLVNEASAKLGENIRIADFVVYEV